jgi:hypothetical protein
MANYDSYSPWKKTDQSKGYLDIMTWRNFPAEFDDIVFTVTKSYEHRPDLLSYDLYGTEQLWWVFAQRNPSTIKDPVFDMTAGRQIYLPKITTLKKALGF